MLYLLSTFLRVISSSIALPVATVLATRGRVGVCTTGEGLPAATVTVSRLVERCIGAFATGRVGAVQMHTIVVPFVAMVTGHTS